MPPTVHGDCRIAIYNLWQNLAKRFRPPTRAIALTEPDMGFAISLAIISRHAARRQGAWLIRPSSGKPLMCKFGQANSNIRQNWNNQEAETDEWKMRELYGKMYRR